ncbi:MAG: sodium-dependent transporter [Planctomycetota bacterium]|jgi:NSS family neurotransmitter:Na+ symporter
MGNSINGIQWRSQSAFIIVATGATLSLNDFLTFPVLVGQNGGGIFLLLYVIFLLVLGLPLLMAELMIGRLGRSDPSRTFEILASQQNASVYWKTVGFISLLAAFLIVATLSVIAGWPLSYIFKSGLGIYSSLTAEGIDNSFSEFIMDTESMMLWHTLFIVLLVMFGAQQLRKGIERISYILVPGMVVIIFIGFVIASNSPGFETSVRYLLYADFSNSDPSIPLLALQRAFYTLALGLGAMIIYGSYLPGNISIGYSAVLVITIDLLLSIIVGLTINTFIFSAGMLPGVDSQYAYRILPYVFNQNESGQFLAVLFYLMLTVAALTTSFALMEGPVSYVQRKFRYSRIKSVVLLGMGIWAFGLGSIFSYSVWNSDGVTVAFFYGGEAFRIIYNAGFHDVMVYLSSHIIQPLAALFLCIFIAWVIPREVSHKELAMPGTYWYEIWNYVIRYITPVLLLIVVLDSFGII